MWIDDSIAGLIIKMIIGYMRFAVTSVYRKFDLNIDSIEKNQRLQRGGGEEGITPYMKMNSIDIIERY